MDQGNRQREHIWWEKTDLMPDICVSQSAIKFFVFWDPQLHSPLSCLKWVSVLATAIWANRMTLSSWRNTSVITLPTMGSHWDYKSGPTLNQDKRSVSLTLKSWAVCPKIRESPRCSSILTVAVYNHSFLLPRPLGGSGVCLLTFLLNPPYQFYELLSILIDLFCMSHFNTRYLQASEQQYEVVLNMPAALSHCGSASSAGHGFIHSGFCTGEGVSCCRQLWHQCCRKEGEEGWRGGSGALFLMELSTVWRLKTILITKQCFLSCT